MAGLGGAEAAQQHDPYSHLRPVPIGGGVLFYVGSTRDTTLDFYLILIPDEWALA